LKKEIKMTPQNNVPEGWVRISGMRIDDAVDAYEHDIDRQKLELKRILANHGLDISKPMLSRYESDRKSWLLREDIRGECVMLDKLRLG
jgi:hypothetical protein